MNIYRRRVIQEADKGSAVVVRELKEYREEAYKQLSEMTVYEQVCENSLDQLCKEVDRKLIGLKETGIISEENSLYFKEKENGVGRLYHLPKIHKRLINVPGRPVVSNCGTPTERISEFVDFYLQPIVKTLPHVVKIPQNFCVN